MELIELPFEIRESFPFIFLNEGVNNIVAWNFWLLVFQVFVGILLVLYLRRIVQSLETAKVKTISKMDKLDRKLFKKLIAELYSDNKPKQKKNKRKKRVDSAAQTKKEKKVKNKVVPVAKQDKKNRKSSAKKQKTKPKQKKVRKRKEKPFSNAQEIE